MQKVIKLLFSLGKSNDAWESDLLNLGNMVGQKKKRNKNTKYI